MAVTNSTTVQVLDLDGINLGEMSFQKAQILARDKNLDLVQINKKDETFVYRIMDQGRWKYLKKKSDKKTILHHLKEMHFSLNIGQHDTDTKLNHIRKFLEKGETVKISVDLRGREKRNNQSAADKLQEILVNLNGVSRVNDIKLTPNAAFVTIKLDGKKAEKG